MTNWSNEETLAFLEAYQSESCIWDPKDSMHKDRKKVADAWCRLSDLVKKPVKELKMKKEILMAAFRRHLKRKEDSIRSGAGAEDVYQPTWFAYDVMESFLTPVYRCNKTINTETQSQGSSIEMTNDPGNSEVDDARRLLDDESQSTYLATPTPTQKSSRRRPAPNESEQQMAAAIGKLSNFLDRRFETPMPPEDDECDLYGKLLAKKLRELPNVRKKILMYQIDGLFMNFLHSNQETSPQQSSISPDVNIYQPLSMQSSSSDPAAFFQQLASSQPSSSQRYINVEASEHSLPKYRRSSFKLPQSPLNAEEAYQPNLANVENSRINLISNEIISPSLEPNIITEALSAAFESFEENEN